MPEKVQFDDGTTAMEYTIQEIEEYAMQKFLEQSHRWKQELQAAEEPEVEIVDNREPKYTDPRTPNRYKRL